jgi:hypothetical protein
MGMFDRLKSVGGSDATRKPHRFGVAGEDAAPSDNLSKSMNESGGIVPAAQSGTTSGTGLVAGIKRAVRGAANAIQGTPENTPEWREQSKQIAARRDVVEGARIMRRLKRGSGGRA